MDSGECIKQEDAGDSMPSDRNLPKPFWVRHLGLQTDAINQRLLDYNVRIVFVGGSFLWLVLHFI
jgi:hypothetical protein